jgi:acyl-CoA thioesterase-1
MMKWWLAAALAATVVGCAPRGDDAREPPAATVQPRPASATATPAAPPSTRQGAGARPRIAVLGDSLTAGLGLPRAASFPSLLQERLDAAGLPFEVVNAGVSGDTSAGGLARLDWAAC